MVKIDTLRLYITPTRLGIETDRELVTQNNMAKYGWGLNDAGSTKNRTNSPSPTGRGHEKPIPTHNIITQGGLVQTA